MNKNVKKILFGAAFVMIFMLTSNLNVKDSNAEINQRFHEYVINGEETQVIICDGSGTRCKVRGTVTIQPIPQE